MTNSDKAHEETKVAMEKIDEATGSAILDPPPTPKRVARARASIENAGGFVEKPAPDIKQ